MQIKIQPSNGVIRNKEGKIGALVWVFRPDVVVEEQHWFETDDTSFYLCIETGPDNFPVNCKKVYRNCDGPSEWKRVDVEEVFECLRFCCRLLSEKERDMKSLGSEILNDTLLGNIKKCS